MLKVDPNIARYNLGRQIVILRDEFINDDIKQFYMSMQCESFESVFEALFELEKQFLKLECKELDDLSDVQKEQLEDLHEYHHFISIYHMPELVPFWDNQDFQVKLELHLDSHVVSSFEYLTISTGERIAEFMREDDKEELAEFFDRPGIITLSNEPNEYHSVSFPEASLLEGIETIYSLYEFLNQYKKGGEPIADNTTGRTEAAEVPV